MYEPLVISEMMDPPADVISEMMDPPADVRSSMTGG